MATDRLINQTQGEDIIDQLHDIATNVGNITYGPQTSADKVVSMTGYAKAPAEAAISQGDTLNEAIGKLEKKADDNATAVADKIDKLTSATAGDIATVTATGEIADSAVAIETTLSDSSDAEVPTSKAVGTYVDGKGYAVGVSSSTANNLVAFNDANGKALKDSGIAVAKSTTGLADSDTAVPTSKTVKTYVDSTATGISRYLGTITAASGLSTDAKKGDFYIVKTAWTGVHVGDEIIAEKNSPSQTIDGTNWSLLHNEADTDTKYTFATGDDNGTFKVTPSDTGTTQSVSIKGLGSTAYTTADTSSLTNDNNHVPTSALAKTLLDAKVPTGNVTTTLPASSAAASTSKVMSEKLVYDTYVPNSDFVVAEQNIAYVSNQVGKNILACSVSASQSISYNTGTWNGNVYTLNNATATINDDGTIKIVKTDTTNRFIIYLAYNVDPALYVGKWINGCPTGGGNNVYTLNVEEIVSPYGTRALDSGSGAQIQSTTRPLSVYIVVAASTTTGSEGLLFKPMICDVDMKNIDPSYQPYALPNSDLTRLEVEDRVALAEEIDAGAKNLLALSSKTVKQDSDNVVAVVDGATNEITLNISSTASVVCYIGLTTWTAPADGYYYLYAENASEEQILVYDDGNWVTYNIPGQSKSPIAYWTKGTSRNIFLRVASGTPAVTNRKIKVMICTKAAFGVSSKFVPYRPNWDLVASVNKYEKTNMVFTTDSAITSVFDLENSYAYQYYNAFLGKVIVYMDLLTKASISTLDSKTIAWVKNGTNNTYNFEWTQPVTSEDAIFRFTKPNTSTGVVMRLQSGTVAAGVHIYVRFEYDIY